MKQTKNSKIMKTLTRKTIQINNFEIIVFDLNNGEFTCKHIPSNSIVVYTSNEIMEEFGLTYNKLNELKNILK